VQLIAVMPVALQPWRLQRGGGNDAGASARAPAGGNVTTPLMGRTVRHQATGGLYDLLQPAPLPPSHQPVFMCALKRAGLRPLFALSIWVKYRH